MTDLIIQPSVVSGAITIPASKSHSIRAILLASLAKGTSRIKGALDSLDVYATIAACRQIGAEITQARDELVIRGLQGHLEQVKEPIDAQNSGQVLRFMGALAALSAHKMQITGDESVQKRRVVAPLLKGLQQLGVEASSLHNNNQAPIVIKGPAKPGRMRIDGQDSQPVSALLMLSAFLDGETEIEVINPGEKPWIDLTLDWLKKLKVHYERKGYHYYKVYGQGGVSGFDYEVAGDFSSASFPAATALLNTSSITLKNLNFQDPQGDKALFDIFTHMGAHVEIKPQFKEVLIQGGKIHGQIIDVNPMIDAIAILAVVGCFAKGAMELTNAQVARYKESDRLRAICLELKKMGAKIDEKKDRLKIFPSQLHGATLSSHQDHRIAMALCVAALHAHGSSRILNADCIAKSYPNFVKDMKQLGAQIEVV